MAMMISFKAFISPQCRPCEKLRPLLTADPLLSRFSNVLSNAWSGRGLSLLWRLENEGMDFAAHNVSPQSFVMYNARPICYEEEKLTAGDHGVDEREE